MGVGADGGQDGGADVARDAGEAPRGGPRPELPYALTVESFTPGAHAGFGQSDLPDVVLGPPAGVRAGGSLDVLSLGVGGEIVLGFGPRAVTDGPGADLVVFENAFYVGGGQDEVFAEAGEVSVSDDGETWATFPCEAPRTGHTPGAGCAGATPTRVFDPEALVPIAPEESGGDAFDLADLGLSRARFVRIVDRAHGGDGASAGFDLDAVGLVHFTRVDPVDGGISNGGPDGGEEAVP